MQVFTPYDNPLECAIALWNDKKRFNKQIIECRQIINAINGSKSWANHPITKMYKANYNWLNLYLYCFENYRQCNIEVDKKLKKYYYRNCEEINILANMIKPKFLTKEFCDQHKRRLYTKAPRLYNQFLDYGISEENWYVIDGKLFKYVKGKIVK